MADQTDATAIAEPATADATGTNGVTQDAERRFTQADIDRVVKERLERADEKARRERDRADQQAETARLEAQGELTQVNENLKAQIAELESKVATLDSLTAERDAAYAVVAGLVEADLKAAPDYVQELIAERPVTEQLDYLNKHRDKWTKTRPNGAGPSPNPAGPLSRDEMIEAEYQAQRQRR